MSDQKYKVSVKNGAGWRKYGGVRLLISVGQPYHESEKLAAVVQWANDNKITAVNIAVNDGLQGWNALADGIGGAKAFADAERSGEEWINRNAELLRSFRTTSVTMTRWKQWLEDKAYPAAQSALAELMAHRENGLAAAIQKEGEKIYERRRKNAVILYPEKFLACSREFIQEEIVVLALQHKSEPKLADVYPGSMLDCMKWFKDPSHPLPAELEPLRDRYFCRIDFDRIAL